MQSITRFMLLSGLCLVAAVPSQADTPKPPKFVIKTAPRPAPRVLITRPTPPVQATLVQKPTAPPVAAPTQQAPSNAVPSTLRPASRPAANSSQTRLNSRGIVTSPATAAPPPSAPTNGVSTAPAVSSAPAPTAAGQPAVGSVHSRDAVGAAPAPSTMNTAVQGSGASAGSVSGITSPVSSPGQQTAFGTPGGSLGQQAVPGGSGVNGALDYINNLVKAITSSFSGLLGAFQSKPAFAPGGAKPASPTQIPPANAGGTVTPTVGDPNVTGTPVDGTAKFDGQQPAFTPSGTPPPVVDPTAPIPPTTPTPPTTPPAPPVQKPYYTAIKLDQEPICDQGQILIISGRVTLKDDDDNDVAPIPALNKRIIKLYIGQMDAVSLDENGAFTFKVHLSAGVWGTRPFNIVFNGDNKQLRSITLRGSAVIRAVH